MAAGGPAAPWTRESTATPDGMFSRAFSATVPDALKPNLPLPATG
jgi:hypothetical protein